MEFKEKSEAGSVCG